MRPASLPTVSARISESSIKRSFANAMTRPAPRAKTGWVRSTNE
jgi:hypothetical protein